MSKKNNEKEINKETKETIKKAEKGEDLYCCETIEELFEKLESK